jgi:hypothetical protein
MIIKARSRANGGALADYLLSVGKFAKNREENERIEIWEALAIEYGDTLHSILQSFEETALPSSCRKPLYHVQMRTDAGEHLTREQWLSAVDRLEQRLGLEGHERVVGEKAKAVRDKLADLDRAALPSVEDAQAMQRKRGRGRKQAVTPDGPARVAPQSRIIVGINPETRPPARDDPPRG